MKSQKHSPHGNEISKFTSYIKSLGHYLFLIILQSFKDITYNMLILKKIIFSVILIGIGYWLMHSYFENFRNFQKALKKIKANPSNLYTPNSGRQVLPAEAQFVLLAIDSFHLKDYYLFKSFGDYRNNNKIIEKYQRIMESSWPVKNDSTSRNLIGYTSELSALKDFKIILQYKNICVGTY